MKLIFILCLPLSIMLSCGNSKEAATDSTSETNQTVVTIDEDKTEDTKNNETVKTNQQNSNTSTTNMETSESQKYEILLQEAYGGLEMSEERVIRSSKGLQEVYVIINRFRRPGLPVPEVDFSSYMVVALFMGEKPTGGHSIDIHSIDDSLDEKITIKVQENAPSADEASTAAICQPFCFVKIPISKKEVVFKKI